ncbi:MAG: hypothetical protein NZV14_16880 [Bryobacteraceae bacterium]|nr:hypothetical protein [Bryobacteraceae bacterium]MDW8379837.1 hypothetical protein [Bryobacterales bacterium]
MSQDGTDRQFTELLAAYRQACPDVELSPTFMPGLWQKIERRRSLPVLMGRFVRLFAGASAVLCLLMMALLFVSPVSQPLSYLDVLHQENQTEMLAYADLEEEMSGESSWR